MSQRAMFFILLVLLTFQNVLLSLSARKCKSPSKLANGLIIGKSYDIGKRIIFRCHPGYKQKGAFSAQCKIDLKWSNPPPKCELISCSHPNIPENSFIYKGKRSAYTYGDRVFIRCNQGYSRLGSPFYYICSHSGWNVLLSSSSKCVHGANNPTKKPMTASKITLTTGCYDYPDKICRYYKEQGYCKGKYGLFLKENCPKTCGFCKTGCNDNVDTICGHYKKRGYCQGEYDWVMKANCAKTCGFCKSGDEGSSTSRPITVETRSSEKGERGSSTARPATVLTSSSEKVCSDRYGTEKCRQLQRWDFCKGLYEDFMSRNCERTCGLCQPGDEGSSTSRPITVETRSSEKVADRKLTSKPKKVVTNSLTNGCVDKSKYCDDFKRRNYCKENYVEYMMQNCRKTCGFCSPGDEGSSTSRPITVETRSSEKGERGSSTARPVTVETSSSEKVCSDRYGTEKCRKWQRLDYCKGQYEGFMSRNCERTCGLCQPANCGDPGSPDKGRRFGAYFKSGGVVNFECDPGYVLVGKSSITCQQATATWSDKIPECKANCGDPGSPDKGTRLGADFRSDGVVNFVCDPGYVLVGESSITCQQATATWSDKIPYCKARPCGDPGNIEGGRLVAITGYVYQAIATYQCNDKYEMDGDKEIRCKANGQWDTLPRCIGCNDRIGTARCSQYRSYCKEDNGQYKRYMMTNCQKTCGFCKPDEA